MTDSGYGGCQKVLKNFGEIPDFLIWGLPGGLQPLNRGHALCKAPAADGGGPGWRKRRRAPRGAPRQTSSLRPYDPGNCYLGPPISEKLWKARSRLYQHRFLQPNTHFAVFFEIYSRPSRAKKKIASNFSSPEKKEHLVENHHQGRPSRAPVTSSVILGSTVGQCSVNVGSTLCQPWVNVR